MGPHDSGVDHQPLQIGLTRQRGENLVQNPHLDPPIITSLDRFVVAKRFRQVAPASTRTRHPQKRVQEPTIVSARPSFAFPTSRDKLLQPLPLIVPKRIAVHR
jgi:hypothetical protein